MKNGASDFAGHEHGPRHGPVDGSDLSPRAATIAMLSGQMTALATKGDAAGARLLLSTIAKLLEEPGDAGNVIDISEARRR